jgi:hypothetical protein
MFRLETERGDEQQHRNETWNDRDPHRGLADCITGAAHELPCF